MMRQVTIHVEKVFRSAMSRGKFFTFVWDETLEFNLEPTIKPSHYGNFGKHLLRPGYVRTGIFLRL